jgi:hypothetical protein
MHRIHVLLSSGFLMVGAACGDVTGVQTARASGPSGPRTSTSGDLIVQIRYANAAPFVSYQKVRAGMGYDGLHARMSGSATLNEPSGSSGYTLGPVTQEKFGLWNFFGNTWTTEWPIPVRSTCGADLFASVTFEAALNGFSEGGGSRLDYAETSRTAVDSQSDCVVNDETRPGSGNSAGGGPTGKPADNDSLSYCVWRIWYDPATGEVIWSVRLYCSD